MIGLIILVLVGYGLVKAGKFVKNNPGQSLEAAKWIKGMFGK